MRISVFTILAFFLSVPSVSARPPQQGGSAGAVPPTAVAPADPGGITIEENVVYSSLNGTDLHLDVYQPATDRGTEPRPAVLLIHGGGWTAFDKSTMQRMGGFLARNGFVAFAVDYLLFDGKQNRWPTQLDDVQRAVRWVRAHASNYKHQS